MKKNNIKFLLKENSKFIKYFKSDPLKKYNNILLVGFTGLLGINILISLINFKKKFNYNKKITCINSSKIDSDLKKFIIINKINYFKKDITNDFQLKNTYDLIIFAAGYSSPSKFMAKSEKTILTHSVGLNNISKYLKKNGKLVYFSSSEIYNGLKKNFNEFNSGNVNYDNPRAPYIIGKKFGESYCNLKEKLGHSILILRLCLAYGPGTNLEDARVLNELITKSLKHKKIKLLDKGIAVRNYIYINDMLFYFFSLINKSKYNLYNLTGNSVTTIFNLANIISKINNTKLIKSNNKNGIPGAVKYINISSKRLNAEYKKKHIKLEEGLRITNNWYKLLLNIN